MGSFYLDRRGCELKLEGNTLVARQGEQRQTVPLALLERLIIAANVRLDTSLLSRLAEAGVTVVLLDPHRSARKAQLTGAGHNHAELRLHQYRASLNGGWSLDQARRLVTAKIKRHRRWLLKITEERPDQKGTCRSAAGKLQRLIETLTAAENLSQLRGSEGSGGKIFFETYTRLFPIHLGFQGRRRRPPPDPVNAVLSLAYTLLHARAVQILWAQGLDPMIGFYHQPYWGRESLACDLIEPWRPCVDAWVYRWFRDRWLEAGHFSRKGESCRLGKAGRSRFFGAFESRVKPIHRAMRQQARFLIKELSSCPKPSI